MNDEIKEILDRLEKISYYADVPKELAYITTNVTPQEIKLLLDYITNLQKEIQKKEAMYDSLAVDYRLAQEENERLKNDVEDISCSHFILFKSNEDYKSRVEKAIESLKLKQIRYVNESDYVIDDGDLQEEINILQNGSDEE